MQKHSCSMAHMAPCHVTDVRSMERRMQHAALEVIAQEAFDPWLHLPRKWCARIQCGTILAILWGYELDITSDVRHFPNGSMFAMRLSLLLPIMKQRMNPSKEPEPSRGKRGIDMMFCANLHELLARVNSLMCLLSLFNLVPSFCRLLRLDFF